MCFIFIAFKRCRTHVSCRGGFWRALAGNDTTKFISCYELKIDEVKFIFCICIWFIALTKARIINPR